MKPMEETNDHVQSDDKDEIGKDMNDFVDVDQDIEDNDRADKILIIGLRDNLEDEEIDLLDMDLDKHVEMHMPDMDLDKHVEMHVPTKTYSHNTQSYFMNSYGEKQSHHNSNNHMHYKNQHPEKQRYHNYNYHGHSKNRYQ